MVGFVSGFADGLSAGLDRNERARARKKNQNQPDYTDIDNKYGTGVGAWIGRQKSGISDWLHRNTGGVLGHSSDPMSGGGQPWDEKMDLGSGVGAVDLGGGGSYVQSEARGGRVRGYADGGGVVRSFVNGGSSADEQPRFDLGDAYSGDPRFDRDASIRAFEERRQEEDLARRVDERKAREGTEGYGGADAPQVAPGGAVPLSSRSSASGPSASGSSASGPSAASSSAPPYYGSEGAASGEDRMADSGGGGAPSTPGAPTIGGAPTAPAGPQATSRAGRWWAAQHDPNSPARQEQSRQAEVRAMQARRAELSSLFAERTPEQQKADQAELQELDRGIRILTRDREPTPPGGSTPPVTTPVTTPGAQARGEGATRPQAVPVPAAAARTPAPGGAPAGAPPAAAPPPNVAGVGIGLPWSAQPSGGAPTLPPAPVYGGGPGVPAPAAKPPATGGGTATASVPSGTGGGTGAAPVAPKPPGSGNTRTAAYDPDKEGPGAIPVGTVVTGSSGTPSAVQLAGEGQGTKLTPYDEHEMLSEALNGGTRHLRETFDQNRTTAVPGAPDPQKEAGLKMLHAGLGAPGPDQVHKVDQALKAHGLSIAKVDKWQSERLVRGYQFYKMRGDTKHADAFAAELLQHHNVMLQKYGNGALDALRKGDPIAAEKHILDGYNIHVPDGMTARKGEGNSVEFVNPKGVVVKRMAYTPQNLWTAATGMSNGSLFHQELLHRYQNSAQHKAELREQRAEAREQRAIDAGDRADKREARAEARDQRRGAGGGGGGTLAPSSFGYAEGGMVEGAAEALGDDAPAQAVSLKPMELDVDVSRTSPSSGGDAGDGGAGTGSGDGGAGDGGSGGGGGADGGSGGTYRRGGPVRPKVSAFADGGMQPPQGFFTNREGLAPATELPPGPEAAEAVPLTPVTPGTSPSLAPTLDPDASPGGGVSAAPAPAETPTKYASVEDPDPWHVPNEIYHQGERVVETPITPYEVANPDDVRPGGRADPEHPEHYPNPDWRRSMQAKLASGNKGLIAQGRAEQKQHDEAIQKYKRDVAEHRKRELDYVNAAKAERKALSDENKAHAKAVHGGVIPKIKEDEYASGVDEAVKKFAPDETEKGTTPFDQVVVVNGKSKPVVDPLDNRQLITEIALRNPDTPTDKAVDTYTRLVRMDPEKPNWRAFENRGKDADGNVIIVPKIAARDDRGNIIKGKWVLDRSREIHMSPQRHQLLNKVITQRISARQADATKAPETSIWGELGKGVKALVPKDREWRGGGD